MPRWLHLTSLRQGRRAVSMTGYALMVGLIAVVALLAVGRVGTNVNSLFGNVSNRLGNAQNVTSSGSGSGGGGTPASCKAIYDGGQTTIGNYTIDPDGAGPIAPYSAFCDMINAGGGWTLCAWYNGGSSTGLQSLGGPNWGADPLNQSATGMRNCEALRSASATKEVLLLTATGSALRYIGVASSWQAYTSSQFVSWPGSNTGTPMFSAGSTGEHSFGLSDPDYNFGATCGNYSPANYQITINMIYHPNSGGCAASNGTSGGVEFGIHDRENCNLCTCDWRSCWSTKTTPGVGIYVR